jgi:putative intracellular protease/amidase
MSVLAQHARRLRLTTLVSAALLAGLAAGPASAQPAAAAPDFDAAMRALRFDPVAADWNQGDGAGNGIPDGDELAFLAEILRRPSLDLSRRKGLKGADVAAAWTQAFASATKDMSKLATVYPTAATVAAGYAMLGKRSLDAYSAMSNDFGAPLSSAYDRAVALERFLSADGDADGDGVSNRAEYAAQKAKGRAAFIAAALDPAITASAPSVATATSAPAATTRAKTRTVGIVLYNGFESLDVFGPLEMWANTPEFKVVLVAQHSGSVKSAQGVSVEAPFSFETAPALDVVMVPGGVGTYTELQNPKFLDYLRAVNQKSEITTSVCTGSALLAKAGLLSGKRATSNKAFFKLATDQDATVQWVPTARWVEDGKFITSSGVSAGTDMALGLIQRLLGKERATALAYSLEYQWNDDPANDPFTREAGKAKPPTPVKR